MFIGALSYETRYRVRNFDLSRDPQVLAFLVERVLTLTPSLQTDGELSVECTAMDGDVVATLEVG